MASRKARVVTAVAGTLVHLVLGSRRGSCWPRKAPLGSFTQAFAATSGMIQWQALVVALYPFCFIEMDGYHVLVDVLGVPTLKQEASQLGGPAGHRPRALALRPAGAALGGLRRCCPPSRSPRSSRSTSGSSSRCELTWRPRNGRHGASTGPQRRSSRPGDPGAPRCCAPAPSAARPARPGRSSVCVPASPLLPPRAGSRSSIRGSFTRSERPPAAPRPLVRSPVHSPLPPRATARRSARAWPAVDSAASLACARARSASPSAAASSASAAKPSRTRSTRPAGGGQPRARSAASTARDRCACAAGDHGQLAGSGAQVNVRAAATARIAAASGGALDAMTTATSPAATSAPAAVGRSRRRSARAP